MEPSPIEKFFGFFCSIALILAVHKAWTALDARNYDQFFLFGAMAAFIARSAVAWVRPPSRKE